MFTPRWGRALAVACAFIFTPLLNNPAQAQTLSTGPFSSVGVSGLTASWSSTFPGGTLYYAELSSSPAFAAPLTSSNTLNLSATFSGLNPNTTYYAQVSTAPGGPTTALGSTVTWIQPPSSVYIDEVTSHSVVAAAYAPTPAFTNLNLGLSGTNVARDGSYAGWHGERWTTKASLATARYGLNVAALNGLVYAVGGYNGAPLTTNASYDPRSNSWTARTGLPSGRLGFAMATQNGLLYAIGGETSVTISSANTVYDPVSNAWTTKATLPVGLGAMPAAVLSDGLHTFAGGTLGGIMQSFNYVYDAAANSWTARAPLPSVRYSEMAAVVGGKAYVIGGYGGVTLSSATEYDPGLNAWTSKAAMPTPRHDLSGGVIGGKIYAVGGADGAVLKTANEEYDPAADVWMSRAPLPSARNRAGAAVLGGRLYVAGGINGTPSAVHEEYDPGVAQEFTGLQPNTLYTFKAKARNISGLETAETADVSTYTLAAVPTAATPTFTGVFNTSVTVAWTANGNPGGTEYRLHASTASNFNGAASSVTLSWTTALSTSVLGLSSAATWYFRAQARNAVGVQTAYNGFGSTMTAAFAPLSSAPFSGLSPTELTASWGSPYPAGTLYYAQISSSPGFAAPLTSSSTLNLSASFSGLVSNTSYYARVATAPAGPFTALGSTITHIEAPTTVYFEEVSSHSIVAWAYAPGANAFRLTGGLSAANIARGGAYAGWKADTWAFIAPMSTNRNNSGLAAHDGRLYAFGGHNGTTYVSTAEFYDPVANAWSARASLPAARSDFGLAYARGRVYVVGGTAGGPVVSTNYEYDPAANSWATKGALSTARSYVAVGHINGSIYAAGGWTGSAYLSSLEAYDIDLDSWTFRTAAPLPRANGGSAVLNESLYVVAGGTSATATLTVRNDLYNPGSNAWFTGANAPNARSGNRVIAAGRKLYLFGGTDGALARAEVEEYDPAEDTWVRRSTAAPFRSGFGIAMLDGKIYGAGGGDSVAVTSTAWAFDFGRSRHFAGLQPNTLYTFKAKARNMVGIETGETSDVSTYTLAAVPGAFAFSFVGASSVSVQWTAAGNPGGTEFQAALAVSSSFASASTTPWTADMLSLSFAGLSAGSTYFARVRARNAVGITTDYAASLSTRTGFSAVAGCGVTRDVSKSGPGYATITAGLAAVPATLTTETCIVVRDTATYVEQVTVSNKATNGFRLRILRDPALTSPPTVQPPAASTAAFQIKASSVSLEGLRVAPVAAVGWGVLVSSSDALLSGVLVQSTASIAVAGLELASWGRVEDSTVSVGNSRAVYFNGAGAHHNVLNRSSFTNASSANHAVWVSGPDNSLVASYARNTLGVAVLWGDANGLMDRSTATIGVAGNYAVSVVGSSTTVSRSYLGSAIGRSLSLGGSYNSVLDSTVTTGGASEFAMLMSQVTRSTVSRSYIYSASGPPLSFQASANWNRIEGSTVVTGGTGWATSLQASSFNTLTDSYFSAPGGGGLSLTAGSGANTLSGSTVAVYNTGLYFQNSSLNTVSWNHVTSTGGTAVHLEMGSNGNAISQSTMVSQAPAGYALYLTTSSGNSVTRSLVTNTTGYAAFFAVKADSNSIDLSTVTARVSGYSALYLDNAATNTFTRSYFANLAGNGVTFGAGASSNTLSLSTVASSGATARALSLFMAQDSFVSDSWLLGADYGAYAELSQRALVWRSTVTGGGAVPGFMVAGSSGVVLRDSYAAGPDALNIYSSSATAVEGTRLIATGGSGKALQFLQGSNGLTVAGSTLSAASVGLVLEAGARPPWAFLSFSVTAATGVQFQGGTVVATMNLTGFQSASGVNVDATGLSAASRVTLRDSAGSRAGTLYENDPASLADWVPDPNPVVFAGPFSQVSSNSLTASWTSGHPAGTLYYARASTDAAFSGTVLSSDTFGLSAAFSALSPLTTYYARVATAPAGPFTTLGSTRTHFGDLPGCATSKFVLKAGGGDCSTITGCVALIPLTPLTGDYCIAVMDSAVYSEQVTFSGQDPNGFRIRLWGAAGARPTVNPPAPFITGFTIFTASVSVTDINVVPTNPLMYGVFAWSPHVNLSSMSIDSGGKISGAGIFLSSFSAVSFSSITVQNADGVRVTGAGNTISFTTAASGGKAFYLHGPSSTTLQDSFAYGMYGVFLYHSHLNTLVRTTMRKLSATPGGAGLYLNDASSNVVTGSIISNAGGTGADLSIYAHNNVIELSTLTAAGAVYDGLLLGHGNKNRFSRLYVYSRDGNAGSLSSGASETLVELSTFVSAYAGARALGTNGSSETLTGNMLYAPQGTGLGLFGSSITSSGNIAFTATPSYPALYIAGGGYVTIRDSSFENSAGDGGKLERTAYIDIVRSTITGASAGLKLEGSSTNTVTASRLASSGGPGLSVGSYLELFDMTTVTGTGNSFSGLQVLGSPAVRLAVARGVALSSSVLEANPGAVALEALNDVLVATLTALRFEGGAYGAEALSLPAGSRLTMRDASGALAGSLYELDPRGVVDWLPDPAPSAAPNTCGDVLVVRSAGGGDCTTIQACVDLIPSAPLSADFCLFIADSALYQEPVVVSGKQPAGNRLRIEGLSSKARPVIQGNSTESVLLEVRVASVTLRNLHLNFPTALGLRISSPNALVENVYVEQWVSDPGITLSSWTTLTNSSVSVVAAFGGSGILVTGVGSVVSGATVAGTGGFALADASSNTLTGLYADNGMCYGMTVERSDFNTVSRSTFIGVGSGCSALHVFGGTYNDFDRLYLYNAAGPAAVFDTFTGPNVGNTLRRSTAVSESTAGQAVTLASVDGFTLSDSWVDGEGGALYASLGSLAVRRSTLTTDSATAPGLAVYAQSGLAPQTVEGSYIRGSTGAFLESVDRVSLTGSSLVATAPDGIALRIYSGINVTLADNALSAPPSGAGLSLQGAETLVVAGLTLNAPMRWKDYVSAELSSVTFQNLPAGATALVLLSADNLIGTFTAAGFPGSLATNVDARPAGASSRVTMRGASGPRAGPAYEADPASVVDWLGVAGTAPAAPTPVLTALGTSSLTWTWGEVAGVWSYDVLSVDGIDLLGSASTGVFTLPSLTPASTYAVRLAVQGSDGSQTLSSPSTGHTLANPPSGLTTLFVTQSSAALSWSLNGNPAGTFAELQRSTDAAAYSVRAGTLSTTAYDVGLIGCTSYYYRVRNRNPVGFDSDFGGPLLVRTPVSTPSAPGDLSAASLPGRRVALTWNPSATEGIVAYRLYKDTGAGAVDYTTPYAQFSGTTFSTTTVALSSGAIHLFGLRAVHRCGTEESNTHAVASAWALESLDGVRASIKVPATGKKISGNRVLVMAELDTGSSSDVSSILFQYRSTGTAAWTDIVAANANHPNPDREQPFFVHWDVTGLADRAYDLRAVASDVVGASDPAPGTITVLVDSVGFEVRETDLGGGKVKKEQSVSNETSNTVATAESGSAVVTKVVLPAGALNTADATLSATANPPALPPPPAAATSLGASIEITLSNGQSQLSNGQTAAIVFNYPDDDGDGVIDGTQIRAEQAEIQTFDVPTNKWKKEFATVVDKDKKTLTGQTPHFSMFAAFGVVQGASLDAVRVYPNPYKPNGGNADEGRPFSRADPLSGVVFDNLPAVVTIKIYTLTGRLVSEFGTSAGTGAVQWDGKNDRGEDVATGGYFAVITSPGSSTVVKKIGVIR